MFKFKAHARSFLDRAREHLATFQASADLRYFFYAALELRFGIEARFTDYLVAELKALGRDPKDLKEYVPSKLLRKLAEIDPDYETPETLTVTSEQSGESRVLLYTPVTKELAQIHGKLGELLHFKFFLKNQHWYLRQQLGGKPNRSVADFVPLIELGVAKLAHATSGTLLVHSRFTTIVQDVLADGNDG